MEFKFVNCFVLIVKIYVLSHIVFEHHIVYLIVTQVDIRGWICSHILTLSSLICWFLPLGILSVRRSIHFPKLNLFTMMSEACVHLTKSIMAIKASDLLRFPHFIY